MKRLGCAVGGAIITTITSSPGTMAAKALEMAR
jgi:hypothetical protein